MSAWISTYRYPIGYPLGYPMGYQLGHSIGCPLGYPWNSGCPCRIIRATTDIHSKPCSDIRSTNIRAIIYVYTCNIIYVQYTHIGATDIGVRFTGDIHGGRDNSTRKSVVSPIPKLMSARTV